MAFPTVTESGSSASGAATQFTLTLPSCDTGDLLIVAAVEQGSATTTQTWTHNSSTSSFTDLYEKETTLARQYTKYRIMDSADSTSLVIDLSDSRELRWSILRIPASTWHGTTPPECGTAVNTGSQNSMDPPSLTPSWGSADTLWLAIAGLYNRPATGGPTDYTLLTDRARVRVAWRQLAASSEDPGTFSSAPFSTYWIGNTVAVPPVGAGAAVGRSFGVIVG